MKSNNRRNTNHNKDNNNNNSNSTRASTIAEAAVHYLNYQQQQLHKQLQQLLTDDDVININNPNVTINNHTIHEAIIPAHVVTPLTKHRKIHKNRPIITGIAVHKPNADHAINVHPAIIAEAILPDNPPKLPSSTPINRSITENTYSQHTSDNNTHSDDNNTNSNIIADNEPLALRVVLGESQSNCYNDRRITLKFYNSVEEHLARCNYNTSNHLDNILLSTIVNNGLLVHLPVTYDALYSFAKQLLLLQIHIAQQFINQSSNNLQNPDNPTPNASSIEINLYTNRGKDRITAHNYERINDGDVVEAVLLNNNNQSDYVTPNIPSNSNSNSNNESSTNNIITDSALSTNISRTKRVRSVNPVIKKRGPTKKKANMNNDTSIQLPEQTKYNKRYKSESDVNAMNPQNHHLVNNYTPNINDNTAHDNHNNNQANNNQLIHLQVQALLKNFQRDSLDNVNRSDHNSTINQINIVVDTVNNPTININNAPELIALSSPVYSDNTNSSVSFNCNNHQSRRSISSATDDSTNNTATNSVNTSNHSNVISNIANHNNITINTFSINPSHSSPFLFYIHRIQK